MTVKELKEVLDTAEPDWPVKVCVNTPAGWVCPDGCAITIKSANHGIDWHTNEILLVPHCKLDIHDIEEWKKPPHKEEDVDEEKKPDEKPDKKEPRIHGYTIPEYVKLMEKAHEATKNSKLIFK